LFVLVAKNIGFGNGAALSALDVLLSMGQLGYDVKLIYSYKKNIPYKLDGKKIKYSNSFFSPREIDTNKKNSIKEISNKILKPYLLYRLKNIKPKMVLVNSMGSHSLWKPIKEKFNWPSTLIIRESPNLYKNLNTVLDRFKYYDYFIFVSDITKKKWLELNIIDKNKCYYIPNCIHEEKINLISKFSKLSIKNKLFGTNKNFICICVGEIKYRKGQDLIINKLLEICTFVPNFKLVLIGRANKNFIKKINNILIKLNLQNRVKIIGHCENAIDFIYASDVLLQPSRSEALPRTIIEAMALKTPIIASDVDGIPELVKDNESAILFNLLDINKMVSGIRRLYQDESYRDILIKNAFNKYKKFYLRKNHIHNYSRFFKNFL